MEDKKFLMYIVILSVLARLVLAPLYVSPPGQAYSIEPHDFPKYIATAETILQGRILYVDSTHTDNSPTPYGPLYVLSLAAWIKVFGTDYTLLKIPSIVYDALTVILIFYVTKSLFNSQSARYAALFYAFSFIPLLISGADGAVEVPTIFFLLLSVYMLIKSKIKLSSLFQGIGLLFQLPLGAIFVPTSLYYLYQQKKLKEIFVYLGVLILTVWLVNSPFFLKAGWNILVQLTYAANHPITGTTLLSAVKMVVNFFTLGMANTYADNPLVQSFATPFEILGFVGGALYILKFGLTDKRIELARNIFVLLLLFTIFGSVGEWHIFVWLIPYLIILLIYNQNLKKFSLSTLEIIGFGLIIASTIIYATLYRETKIPEYTILEQSLLLTSVVSATLGTFLAFKKVKLRIPLTLSIFSWAWWLTNHAKLLMILGSLIKIFQSPLWAYGIQDFSAVVMITVSSLFLLFSFHKIPRSYISNFKSIIKP